MRSTDQKEQQPKPTKSEQIATLRVRLCDPSVPDGLKRHIESAIHRIKYGRVAR